MKAALMLALLLPLAGCGSSVEKSQEDSRQLAREQVVDPAQDAMKKAKDTEKVMADSAARIDAAIDDDAADATTPAKSASDNAGDSSTGKPEQ